MSNPRPPFVLGIETSCDETAAAVVCADPNQPILSNIIARQDHNTFGGVIPEVAARQHLRTITPTIKRALATAKLKPHEIDAVAATSGPGLLGGLIVGASFGQSFAAGLKRPFFSINHLEGHLLSARIHHSVWFPFLILLISGGHTELMIAHDIGVYQSLGRTIDDAAGEAFDKVARALGLGYPGGEEIEKYANIENDSTENKDTDLILPRPMIGRENCDFSFSGLKTAAFRAIQAKQASTAQVCRAMSSAISDCLVDRTARAIQHYRRIQPHSGHLVVAGGVAANQQIKAALDDLSTRNGMKLCAPPRDLCTDNAAMIAWAGLERLSRCRAMAVDAPRPRWPLTKLAAVG
ncbi:MAG: tRNA (adenosine(37)-N6)-threonylcarbamoyltransferase complex transferase subunit TsaD [Pseudomonadota bacterium]